MIKSETEINRDKEETERSLLHLMSRTDDNNKEFKNMLNVEFVK